MPLIKPKTYGYRRTFTFWPGQVGGDKQPVGAKLFDRFNSTSFGSINFVY